MAILKKHNDMPLDLDILSRQVIDAIFSVHKELGPGFLEKIYEEALMVELQERRLLFEKQKVFSIVYKGRILPVQSKVDLIVENSIILELKTVEKIAPIHEAQIISYMKQTEISLGFIVNFNEFLIKNGIKRMVLTQNLRPFASSR